MSEGGPYNSSQAQLGLTGQSGSFNALGIATPAPPPPPPVRHPGDVSQDIVRQTQTAMATTLQTTSAMRLGGMGGVAFGGGGAAGGGIGAAGAFAQQYQQNMAGINAQHIAPFSAQMMGMMGGMGSGFQQGMLPHPAMMTTPGMGIYRPFAPPPVPTVSPFQQMPLFQTPFSPIPPPPQFQTPMELSSNMATQAGQRRTAAMFATPGVAARGAADVGLGYMGAGLGAVMGARFGPAGAAIGGTLGMAAGMFGAEHFGLGATAQHIADRVTPFQSMAARGQQMQTMSQAWVTGGPDLNMMSGRGLSSRGATHLGRLLEDTAYSGRFQRETGNTFSAQDLTKITNTAGQQGLLQDAQSVDQIHDKVKGIAKSLVSFMKIANEPNVVEALKSMGRARAMGLSVGETMDMAMEARMYSKMAGTSVSGIMGGAGMQGAMLYQQQGLSAGLGMRMGMGALGSATAAVGAGAFSTQRLAMLGGTQGVAQREMEMGAAFLKQPMMAMALSTMGKTGEFGVSGGATRELMSGRMDVMQMATRGVNNLLEGVRKQGIGAIAMQEMQSTELQDAIGRIMGPQGTKIAQMNLIEQQRKARGLDRNPGGFAMAGRSLGFNPDDMEVLSAEASSPGYFDAQRRHLQVQKMEGRALENEAFERNRPTTMDRFARTDLGSNLRTAYGAFRNTGEDIVNFFHDDEETKLAKSRGQVMLKTPKAFIMSDEEYRAADAEGMTGERGRRLFAQNRAALGGRGQGWSNFKRGFEDTALGGNEWDVRQRRLTQGGAAEWAGGGIAERGIRLLATGMGLGALTDYAFGSAEEIRQANEDTNTASNVYGAGTRMSANAVVAAQEKLRGGTGGKSGREINIELAGRLGKLARDKTKISGEDFFKWGGLAVIKAKTNNQVSIKESREAARALLKERGVANPTNKEIDEQISLAMPGAKALAGDNDSAFREQETINMAVREKSLAELGAMRSERLSQMTGSSWMTSTGEDEAATVSKRLFQTGKSADAGTLAALKIAGRDGDKEATKKAEALESRMTGTDIVRAYEIMGDLDKSGGTATARKIGGQIAKHAETTEDALALGTKWRADAQVEGTETRRKKGAASLTGRTDEKFTAAAGTEQLRMLSESGTTNLPAPVQDLVDAYEAAQENPEEQARLGEKFTKLNTTAGTVSEREAAGGFKSKTWDKISKEMTAEVSATQNAVGKNFPNVTQFDEASRRLLEAAEYLNNKRPAPSTALPTGAIRAKGESS